MDIQDEYNDVLELTADVVAAYVSNNPLPSSALPGLIASVNAALTMIAKGAVAPVEKTPVQNPAVNPKKSVFPDFIICLEDGKKFKSLKRHLTTMGMTPDEYRAKWNLPADYPMVAPAYSAVRSAMATRMGLGRKPASVVVEPPKKKTRAKRAPEAVVEPAE